jgi:hypothetical protein
MALCGEGPTLPHRDNRGLAHSNGHGHGPASSAVETGFRVAGRAVGTGGGAFVAGFVCSPGVVTTVLCGGAGAIVGGEGGEAVGGALYDVANFTYEKTVDPVVEGVPDQLRCAVLPSCQPCVGINRPWTRPRGSPLSLVFCSCLHGRSGSKGCGTIGVPIAAPRSLRAFGLWPLGRALWRAGIRLTPAMGPALAFSLPLYVLEKSEADGLVADVLWAVFAPLGIAAFAIVASIVLFNGPKWAVAPHLRSQPGLLEEWFGEDAGERPRTGDEPPRT